MSIDGGLRKIFRDKLPKIDWTSIETGGTGRGVPDSNGCVNGVEFWVEYKKTDAWSVTVRPEQIGWISRRRRFGGRVFVAVRRKTVAGPRKGKAVDELWIFSGDHVREIATEGLQTKKLPLYVGEGGPAKWDWSVIAGILVEGR